MLDCPRAFYYKYVENIESKGDSIILLAGSAMHKGLAVIHESWEIEGAVQAMAEELDGATGHGNLDFITAGHLETVLRNYIDHWQGRDPYKVVEMIEEPVIETIDGMQIGGIPDMVVDDDGEVIGLDHKTTTSYLGSHLYNRVKFGKQGPIYCLLLSEKLGIPVRRMVFNCIYTGKYANSVKSKATKFDRYSFEYSEEDLQETREWLYRLVHNIWDLEGKVEKCYPQHGGSHCGWCEYSPLCEIAPPLRDGVKSSSFRQREISGKLLSGADR